MKRSKPFAKWKTSIKVTWATALLATALLGKTLPADGATVFSFGFNGQGQTGLGFTTPVDTRVATPIDTSQLMGATITQFSSGYHHGLLLADDGTVFSTGWNGLGLTGLGTATGNTTIATPIDTTNLTGKTITQVAAGNQHSLLLANDGTVFSFGNNVYGRTGLGISENTNTSIATPIDLSNLQGKVVTQVAAGDLHSLLLADDGTVYSFGFNYSGRTGLGINLFTATLVPTLIDGSKLGGRKITQVAAGGSHSLLLADDGTVFSFGSLSHTGLGNIPTHRTPTVATPILAAPLGGRKITQLSAGDSHSLLLAEDGTVFSFGSNGAGKTGLGINNVDHTRFASPIDVMNLDGKRITQVAAGRSHSMLLADDGTVFSFGTNEFGISGHGEGGHNPTIATPIDATNLAGWRATSISAGGSASFLLAVPEPSTAALAVLAGVSILMCRMR